MWLYLPAENKSLIDNFNIKHSVVRERHITKNYFIRVLHIKEISLAVNRNNSETSEASEADELVGCSLPGRIERMEKSSALFF